MSETKTERVRAVALEYPESDSADYVATARESVARRVLEALDGGESAPRTPQAAAVLQVVHTVATRGGMGEVAGVRIERLEDGETVTSRKLAEVREKLDQVRKLASQWSHNQQVNSQNLARREFAMFPTPGPDDLLAIVGGELPGGPWADQCCRRGPGGIHTCDVPPSH